MSGDQRADRGFVIEADEGWQMLVVAGRWSADAAEALAHGEADGLVLNYARGFCEPDLEFLDSGLRLRSLDVLDRSLVDLAPIARLADSLESLSVQAAPKAQLDLAALPHLRYVAGEWALIRPTLSSLTDLRTVITWEFDEADLHAFRDHAALGRLTIKHAPYLESLSGIGELPSLEVVEVIGGRRLHDISDARWLASSLRRLNLQGCRALERIDDVEGLTNLRFLGVNDCGRIESLAPVAALLHLEQFYAWGTTLVDDNDLSPLLGLPRLNEIRMRDRRDYRPRRKDIPVGPT